MSSQSVILTTAMAVSGAVIYLSLSGIRNFPSTHQLSTLHKHKHKLSNPHSSPSSSSLRSCLSSGGRKREKNKKKRVKFSDHVNVQTFEIDNHREINEELSKTKQISESSRMPANQAALYHGILRDRLHRVQSSY